MSKSKKKFSDNNKYHIYKNSNVKLKSFDKLAFDSPSCKSTREFMKDYKMLKLSETLRAKEDPDY